MITVLECMTDEHKCATCNHTNKCQTLDNMIVEAHETRYNIEDKDDLDYGGELESHMERQLNDYLDYLDDRDF